MSGLIPFAKVRPDDPAELGYPPTLPIEVAMRVATIPEICEAYGLSRSDWERLIADPVFIQDYKHAKQALAKEGVRFKLKAQLQAEELLKKAWEMIHDRTGQIPATVQADLIKFVVRAAGLDGSKAQEAQGAGGQFQISINLGNAG